MERICFVFQSFTLSRFIFSNNLLFEFNEMHQIQCISAWAASHFQRTALKRSSSTAGFKKITPKRSGKQNVAEKENIATKERRGANMKELKIRHRP